MIDYENLAKSNAPFHEALSKKFNDLLKEGWFILGKEVEYFENSFARYHGINNCIGVASGTDSIYLALKALNLPAGSEVIVSGNTYIATILPILWCNLTPKIIEPNIQTYNIDCNALKNNISSNTSAILVTHMYGKSCAMDDIMNMARDFNLPVLEDCSQAHGSKFKNELTGTFGDFGCFSFYPTKNLGALGDAGGILTKHDHYSLKLKTLRNNGYSQKYINTENGINSRLDEIQAAFLSIKLNSLDLINNHKRKLAQIYLSELEDLQGKYILPQVNEDFYDTYHAFAIRNDKRDSLREFLLKNQINTEIHYPIPPHLQKSLSHLNIKKGSLPITELIHDQIISLPISFATTEEEVIKVCAALRKF